MELEDCFGRLFYVRKGIGKSGFPINVYKIRTMMPNAELEFRNLANNNGMDGLGKIMDDPRVTKIGRVLRRYGIDELPQIYNILKGEMSFVGIRPRSEEDWSYLPNELREHALRYKPGWFTPAYSEVDVKDMEELARIESTYLQKKDKFPIKTDAEYLLKILFNFVLKGVRSK